MSAMSSLTKELILLVLQFLDDEKYPETVHRLERESGVFFDIKHFEELVMRGDWDEIERYLSGFTKLDDNRYSMKIFFEIRKQKYLEALDRRDRGAAAEILMKDLKYFAKFNEELFKEIALLLTLENFRENKELRAYRDTNTARTTMFIELKKLIEASPCFQDKLKFPEVQKQRLRTLVNQSLNWQHQLCKAPQNDPDIKTLFVDHACPLPQQNGPGLQVSPHVPPYMSSIPNFGAFPQMAQGVQQYHHQQQLSWITGAPPMPHAGMHVSPVPVPGPSNPAAHLNRPLSPTNGNATVDYHSPDNDPAPKRPRIGQSNQLSTAHYPVTHSDVAQIHDSPDELLPKTLVVTLGQGSTVTSMEFHPSRATLLLVGTNNGDIALWDIASQERLDYKNFEVWDLSSCSSILQESLTKDPAILVKRVAWSHDGSQIGVAYSKHLVHLYTYNRREDLIQHLEIEAHVGGVNDLVFPEPNGLVVVITCGDDKLIKIWDTTSGSVLFTFEGHETPVYSICPQSRENTKFIFSTSFDGKIKAWLYDHSEPKVDFTAPGNSCTRLAYTDDGKRLFSCGTSKDGDTHIVEWNESEGTLKRRYNGLRKPSTGVVQFDMTKNRFLAAGDDFLIKFWDMDSAALLTTTDAEGGLQASPHVRFNKSGSLLAVSTKENSIKVLASVDGLKMLRSCENQSSDAARLVSEALTKVPTIRPSLSVSAMAATSAAMAKRDDLVPSVAELQNGDTPGMEDVKPRIINEAIEKSKSSKLPEFNESSQCSSMRLPDDFSSAKQNVDPLSMEDVKSGINDGPIEKYKPWKLPEIIEPSQCCTLRLPDNISSAKICRMLYTNSGTAVVALASNGVHKLWKWPKTERNTSGKATVTLPPQLWQPPNGILMNNEMRGVNTESAHHFALSKNDSYIMSTSGGKISLFNLMTFKTMTSFMQPPPAATCLAFHPRDNNIVAIGMDDSSIQIYNVRVDEVQSKLQGHQKRITGLAFSSVLSVLVSAGSDDQVCIWAADKWEKQRSTYIRRPSDRGPCPIAAETRVQFHNDLVRFLVVHESQLAIYQAENMKRLQQRLMPQDAVLTNATYSCDGQLIYATFVDGSVSVFTEALQPRCRINVKAYLSVQPSLRVFPLVVAAHPSERNQFALGLTNGSVHVLEPLESEGKWGIAPEGERDPETNASTSNFVG